MPAWCSPTTTRTSAASNSTSTAPDVEADLARLAATCDVIVINSTHLPVPGWDALRRELSWAGPDAVICHLSAFGTGGPQDGWAATHLTGFAASGQMLAAGPPEGPPSALPGFAVYDELAAHAAATIMAALRERPHVGGQVVELSLHDLLAYRDSVQIALSFKGAPRMMSRAGVTHGAPPAGIWEVKDGRVEFLVYNPPHWDGFVTMLGNPPEFADPELRERGVRDAARGRADARSSRRCWPSVRSTS